MVGELDEEDGEREGKEIFEDDFRDGGQAEDSGDRSGKDNAGGGTDDDMNGRGDGLAAGGNAEAAVRSNAGFGSAAGEFIGEQAKEAGVEADKNPCRLHEPKRWGSIGEVLPNPNRDADTDQQPEDEEDVVREHDES